MWSKPQPETRRSIDSKVDPVGFQDLDVSKQFEDPAFVTWKTCNFKRSETSGFLATQIFFICSSLFILGRWTNFHSQSLQLGGFLAPPRTWYVHETSNDLSEDCHLSLNGNSPGYILVTFGNIAGISSRTPSIWHFSREWCTEHDPGSCEFFEGVDRVWNSPKKLVPETEIIRNLCTVRDFEVLAQDLQPDFHEKLIPCSTLKQTWILEHVDIVFLQWDDVLLDIWPWPFSGWFCKANLGKKTLIG